MIGTKNKKTSFIKFGALGHLEIILSKFKEPKSDYYIGPKDAEVVKFLLENEIIRRRIILSKLHTLKNLNLDEEFIKNILY